MKPHQVGIVGAGRSRNGLGPFLAEFLEAAGFVVAAVVGRYPRRSVENAEMLGRLLGHEVKSFPSLEQLCGGVEALVIVSPTEFHIEALRAAVAADLPTLCEKPMVHEKDC